MAKYVNADALADGFDSLAHDDWNQWERTTWANAFKVCAKMVRDGISIDAVPVRHGYWIVDEDGNIKCSECGHRGVGDNYCERCGAKMDAVYDERV